METAGIRTSKTKNGVTTTYYLNGSQIIAEETGDNITVYIYDANGTPIGMQYHAASYADNVWDTFWYEKNLFGDIVAVYGNDGTKLISYTYDAWGQCSTFYHDGTTSASPAAKNPFRYRGYYYDSDLGLYYLQSRYYDSNTGRFISPDEETVITATPDALTDKNLYAYCDNNPVMRTDEDGEFWNFIAGAVIGAAINIVASATVALLNGEDYTLKDALVDGISGAVSGVIASTGLCVVGQTVAGAAVSAGASALSDVVNGRDINWVRMINASALGAATGYIGGAGVRANPAVKKADATCIKVLRKVESGMYATTRGAKSAMTQSIGALKKALKPVVKQTTKSFTRSSFIGASGMYAYDYVNR